MSISVACECGKAFRVPDSYAGKSGKCSRCGSWMKIPDGVEGPGSVDLAIVAAGDPLPDFDGDAVAQMVEEAEIAPVPAPPVTPAPSPGADPETRAARPYDPEPWYYAALVICAAVFIACGLIASVASVGYGIYWIDSMTHGSGSLQASEARPDSAWQAFIVSFGAALGSLATGCSLLLGVDAARNVRTMRKRTDA